MFVAKAADWLGIRHHMISRICCSTSYIVGKRKAAQYSVVDWWWLDSFLWLPFTDGQGDSWAQSAISLLPWHWKGWQVRVSCFPHTDSFELCMSEAFVSKLWRQVLSWASLWILHEWFEWWMSELFELCMRWLFEFCMSELSELCMSELSCVPVIWVVYEWVGCLSCVWVSCLSCVWVSCLSCVRVVYEWVVGVVYGLCMSGLSELCMSCVWVSCLSCVWVVYEWFECVWVNFD